MQGGGKTPTTLLALSAEKLKAQRECSSAGTYRNNRYADRLLNSFVRSRSEQDVPFSALTIEFFEDYRFYLKREGYMRPQR
nr:phage integrase SAM-like domain-containing protein [Porphyromonas asaccharolytica]